MRKKIILLHGALGSAIQMEPLAEQLRVTYDVFMYDFPGHGGKDFPEHAFTLPILSQHLHEYLREFNLVGCDVFGYSMGGYAALWLEAKEQGTFNSIITFATKFDWSPAMAERETSFLDAEKMQAKVPAFVNQLIERHQPNDWKKVLEETVHLMNHLGKNPLSTPDFGNINCKVRLCLGDRDQMITLEETSRTYKELPYASLCVFPETTHPFEKINYKILAEEIQRFIS